MPNTNPYAHPENNPHPNMDEELSCYTCRYEKLSIDAGPCNSCLWDKWESAKLWQLEQLGEPFNTEGLGIF